MGIDKPNVRFIIHRNLPKDVEFRYQGMVEPGGSRHQAILDSFEEEIEPGGEPFGE